QVSESIRFGLGGITVPEMYPERADEANATDASLPGGRGDRFEHCPVVSREGFVQKHDHAGGATEGRGHPGVARGEVICRMQFRWTLNLAAHAGWSDHRDVSAAPVEAMGRIIRQDRIVATRDQKELVHRPPTSDMGSRFWEPRSAGKKGAGRNSPSRRAPPGRNTPRPAR